MISDFRHVADAVFFLFGDSLGVLILCANISEHSVSSTLVMRTRPMKMEQSFPKRRRTKFRCWSNTQKKKFNKEETAMSKRYSRQHNVTRSEITG